MSTKLTDNTAMIKRLNQQAMEAAVFGTLLAVEGQAKELAPVNLARLRGSLTSQLSTGVSSSPESPADHGDSVMAIPGSIRVSAGRVSGRVGTAVEYGAMQEYGGVQRPREAGALTIPVSDYAKRSGMRARDMDLDYIPTKPPRLVDKNGITHFILLQSVRIPPHPFMRPAVAKFGNMNTVQRIYEVQAKKLGLK